jgi:hypothetical protein
VAILIRSVRAQARADLNVRLVLLVVSLVRSVRARVEAGLNVRRVLVADVCCSAFGISRSPSRFQSISSAGTSSGRTTAVVASPRSCSRRGCVHRSRCTS